MELTDIMALVRAGYTKEEIAQMENPAPNAQTPVAEPIPAPQDVPAPEQVVEPAPAPAPAPAPKPVQAPVQDQPTMADIMQGIAKLTSAIQANAIAQSVIPQGLQNLPTAKDVLAEVIRPTLQERR